MRKSRARELRQLAEQSEANYEIHHETIWITGDIANLTIVGSSPYDTKEEYGFKMPVYTRVNNYKRAKRNRS